MIIEKITMFHVQLPMKFNFKTAKGSLNLRDTIIIKVESPNGLSGFGEVVAFKTPFYTSETFADSWKILEETYLPEILQKDFSHPFEIHEFFRNPLPMALAGLENALLDLYFKERNKNLIAGLFQEKLADKIPRGAVLGQMSDEQTIKEIDQLINSGVKRIKLKNSPQIGTDLIKKLVKRYPQITFALDANRSFQLTDWPVIKELDELGLACIEEPFDIKDLSELKLLTENFLTPICFDESVQDLESLKILTELPFQTMLNVKIGRLGGLYQTQKAIEFCRQHQIGFWIGSMVESGISKILHVQLAALSGNAMAGDLSDSKHYFDIDLIQPEIAFPNGWMTVPTGIGIGLSVNETLLKGYTVNKLIMTYFR